VSVATPARFALPPTVAFVTGAGRGIGASIATALGAEGVQVGCFDLNPQSADRTVKQINASGGSAMAVSGDVADADSVATAVALVEDSFGPLEMAVNNAGIDIAGRAEDMSVSDFRKVLDINVTGVFLCAQAEGRSMLSRGRGSIVNIASMSGLITNKGLFQANYNASKAAVTQLTKSMATEWASRGVRVNAVSPGYILTEMNQHPDVVPFHEVWVTETPMGRLALADDIVGPVLFLLSDAAAYCTGVDLLVDGGYTCW